MDSSRFSSPIALREAQISDRFWLREMELVRKNVIPYQWEALNDRVPGASPSFCMHNFRAAARLMARKRAEGSKFIAPRYVYRGFETLPEPGQTPDEDKFYGYVFQDSDFYKWIEAVGYSLARRPDPQLEQTVDGAIDVICAAQDESGYLNTYYILNGMDRALTHLKDHHELYCLGHLIEAAISYAEATGKDKLLRAACRYIDYIAERIGPGENRIHGYPGHEITEMALLRLYERTHEEKHLNLAMYFLNERGAQPYHFDVEGQERAAHEGTVYRSPEDHYAYYQAHKPVHKQEEAVGHAVRAMYLYSGMADAARLTGDEELLAACKKLWRCVVREKLYITGGVGGTALGEAFSHPFCLRNDLAYSETCAAIGLVFFARRMLEISPEREYADVMESALYNTVLSGMALDGRSFFYVNPLSVDPEACRRDNRLQHVKPVRQKWFGCACCPPNIARLVGSLPAYAYTKSETTLYTHLYVGGEVRFGGMTLQIETAMPFEGEGRVIVKTGAPAHKTLAFRLPGWCNHPQIHCAGKDAIIRDGYAYLDGPWRDGDVIELSLPMRVRMQTADPRVREDIGKAAFSRGPLVYCAEAADNGEHLHLLRADAQAFAAQGAQLLDMDIGGHPVRAIRVPGRRILPAEGSALYADYAPPAEEKATITLIPYYAWANRGENEMDVWIRL